ncbi:hypothetical protein D3H55_07860 [Bacillus salacetis]|uniref:Uncharacterized protein n=1 Tax=Bacillus salacetis TaxID=2315464 RepID=A0A3A1R124_9BACI|nr:hypothetical protein D3H55_07860 [Bacillus salacetis]
MVYGLWFNEKGLFKREQSFLYRLSPKFNSIKKNARTNRLDSFGRKMIEKNLLFLFMDRTPGAQGEQILHQFLWKQLFIQPHYLNNLHHSPKITKILYIISENCGIFDIEQIY